MGFPQDKCCEHKQNVVSMKIQNMNRIEFSKKKIDNLKRSKLHIYCRKSNKRNGGPSITIGNIGR